MTLADEPQFHFVGVGLVQISHFATDPTVNADLIQ